MEDSATGATPTSPFSTEMPITHTLRGPLWENRTTSSTDPHYSWTFSLSIFPTQTITVIRPAHPCGGTVRTVAWASQEPVSRRLRRDDRTLRYNQTATNRNLLRTEHELFEFLESKRISLLWSRHWASLQLVHVQLRVCKYHCSSWRSLRNQKPFGQHCTTPR